MGKKRGHENDLADYYFKAAGVAAIWIDDSGHIGAAGRHGRRASEPDHLLLSPR